MRRQHESVPQGVLFDMDGTLIQTMQTSEQTWQAAFTQLLPLHQLDPTILGQIMRDVYASYKKEIAGDSEKQRWDRLHPFEVRTEIVKQVLARAGKGSVPLATSIVQSYEALRDSHRSLTPFALETLGQLRQRNIRLALLTNGNATYQHRKLEQHHLVPYFNCLLIEEEFGVGKSDVRIYQAALEQLHLHADETWMIGDNLSFDIATPQQLGIFTLWFDPQKKGLPVHENISPDRTLHTLPDVLREINALESKGSS